MALAGTGATALIACTPAAPVQRLGLGQTPSAGQIRGWDIDVRADGAGLPAGSGSVAQGRAIYGARCLACHGANGERGTAPRLAGGQGTLADKAPVLTVGSYWPYAPTLYDYIRRAMPQDSPQSLTVDEVYAVTAYTLHLNGIIGAEAVLDAASLAAIRMPNREGFRPVMQ
ncbi:c-type cytochrome [Massilia dura]|uniref:C-type cytochrome n=1 Tax=Pseudoduganella dura TaxID=321982 RepID=A0A6I3XQ74_9BURK|nr:cytochrome c [Pseudoduganella dura]MUI15961.1 c-type cytochrome [Pseudoduganella dura]GGX94825.1 cytochrome c [Pseudoduganella dura]